MHFTSCVTSTSILGTRIMEYAHSNGSSSIVSSPSSSSSSCPVAPGLLPVLASSLVTSCSTLCTPWASLAGPASGNSGEVVGEEVFSQRHVQPLTIPRAHKVCEYSLGNRHCPQWSSPNCR